MNHILARGYSPAQIEAHEARKAREARMRPQPIAALAPPPPSAQARIAALEAEVAALRAQMTVAARREPRVAEILTATAQHYNIREKDILAPGRSARVINARQIAMWAARELTRCSLPQLGRIFKRDHTTVLHSVWKIGAMRQSDPAFAAETDALLAKFAS